MKRQNSRKHLLRQVLVNGSPLRQVDPRTKLVLGLCASLAVMLSLEKLVIFWVFYLLLAAWGRLLPEVLRQLWRVRWILLVLFVVDTWLVGLDFALTITLRVALLTGVFAVFFSTTTPGELGLALEALHLPYRYAFSLSLAMSSLGLLEDEWQAIREAQAVRGVALQFSRNWRQAWKQLRGLVALTVPAIVLTTRRAWAATEAAYARGFDAPHRRPFYELHFSWLDVALLVISLTGIASLILWRLP